MSRLNARPSIVYLRSLAYRLELLKFTDSHGAVGDVEGLMDGNRVVALQYRVLVILALLETLMGCHELLACFPMRYLF